MIALSKVSAVQYKLVARYLHFGCIKDNTEPETVIYQHGFVKTLKWPMKKYLTFKAQTTQNIVKNIALTFLAGKTTNSRVAGLE